MDGIAKEYLKKKKERNNNESSRSQINMLYLRRRNDSFLKEHK